MENQIFSKSKTNPLPKIKHVHPVSNFKTFDPIDKVAPKDP
jgi:hypothetical protein